MPRNERPLEADDSPLGQFAADLRRLRSKAGTPTYRELAGRVNYSVAALSTAANGRRMPSLAVTLAYVRGCGGDVEEWRERWHALVAAVAAERVAEPETEERAPYAGLAAFQPHQADRFFGRGRVVDELAGMVARRRFTGVFGASGSGKSSVLRAGLVARAERGGGPVLVLTPGSRPVEEFAVALAGLAGTSAPALRTELAADPANAHLRIRQAMADRPSDVDLLLVVDQFEEVFTLCGAEDERKWLIDALVTAANEPASRARVVLGVRADFYGHCARYPALVDALRGGQVLVGPMTPEDLREAITRPAAAAGCMVEAALVSRLVADAVGRPSVLPLVSHALLETWRRRSGATLTLAGYEAAGGIEHAIARTAETVYTALTERQREIARQLFVRLTALGERTEDTKRRVSHGELDTGEADTAVVLEKLVSARLLAIDRDLVEITHEALIRNWPRLHGWLTEDREGLRVHRQLTEATEAWEAVDRDPGALYRGARLTLADGWARDHGSALNPREREFLTASLSARTRERAAVRRRTRRLQQLVGLLAVLLLLAAGAVAVAVRAENTATERRDIALARKAVGDAAEIRATNPALSVQLSLAAYQLAPMPETRDGLLSTFATPYAARITAHTDRVHSVSYSEDGLVLATAGTDRTVRLWDVADSFHPRPLGTIDDSLGGVRAVRFRPGGRVLATTGADHTVRLWDLADPARPRRLTVLIGHTAEVATLSFSRDGKMLATGGEAVRLWDVADPHAPRQVGAVPVASGTVRSADLSPGGPLLAVTGPDNTTALWNVSDPAQPHRQSTVDGRVRSAFSPDGQLLATSDDRDHTPNLWDVADPERPRRVSVLIGHNAAVDTLRFSPDGKLLATAGDDNTVLLWDVSEPARVSQIATLTGHTNTVYALAFSPDGSTLASGGGDRTVRLTNLAALPLADHADTVASAAFSADGRVLATASMDHTVRLLDATDPPRPRPLATIRQPDAIFTAEFSHDGRLLATAGRDRTARLWDIADPARPHELSVLSGHTDAVSQAVLSPDGRLAATASWDGSARLWDIADPARPRPLGVATGHSGGTDAAAFSPDGRLLATGAEDGKLRLWDVADPGRPRRLSTGTGHTDSIGRVAFSPDGRHLATGSNDHTVRLWDISDPGNPRTTAVAGGHTDAVYGVAFSPDGRRLATGGQDRAVRLWDISDPGKPAEQAVLRGHTGGVTRVAFSPDGRFVLSASIDRTARLWETDAARIAAQVCALGYPRISRAEWETYFPELDYRPPCR